MLRALFLALAATAVESHPTHHTHPLSKRGYSNGIATFNNYAAQGNTNCGPASGQHGTYGAAASDISPEISGGTCSGSISMSKCAGQSPAPGYQAPGCPKANCGKCYKVTNKGGIGGSIGGVGNSITVQIIDACPASSAHNFCKTEMPANSRCSDPGTNQLDIDHSAYMALTGKAFGSGGPNLNIGIEDADCSGATSAGGSSHGSDVLGAPIPVSSDDLAPGDPGQHAAGGDKLAQHRISGGNLAIQSIGSPDAASPSPSSSNLALSPPPSTPTSTALPSMTSVTPAGVANGDSAPPVDQPQSGPVPEEEEEEEEECEEL